MFRWLKQKWVERKFPRDPSFDFRVKSEVSIGNWRVVELSANDAVVLNDNLAAVARSDGDEDTRGRNVIGLRYMALAMSLRTKSGKIPFNWQDQHDIIFIGNMPHQQLLCGLQAVATLSDIPWVDPHFQSEDVSMEEVRSPSEEEIEQNPS